MFTHSFQKAELSSRDKPVQTHPINDSQDPKEKFLRRRDTVVGSREKPHCSSSSHSCLSSSSSVRPRSCLTLRLKIRARLSLLLSCERLKQQNTEAHQGRPEGAVRLPAGLLTETEMPPTCFSAGRARQPGCLCFPATGLRDS